MEQLFSSPKAVHTARHVANLVRVYGKDIGAFQMNDNTGGWFRTTVDPLKMKSYREETYGSIRLERPKYSR